MGRFYSTKTYGCDVGLSCVFRQWKAEHSHCKYLHGYSLGFRFVFSCEILDERGWVMDFGGLGLIKQMLKDTFDHNLLVAQDDPEIEKFKHLDSAGIARVIILERVGAEAFAEQVYNKTGEILKALKDSGELPNKSISIEEVEVFEHGANSAIYKR